MICLRQAARPFMDVSSGSFYVSAAARAQDTASGYWHGDRSQRSCRAERLCVGCQCGEGCRTATTNGSGDYLFAALPIGSYNLIVTQGFKKYEAKGGILRVGQKARADVTLQVGATKEEITVEGASVAQVETQSSDLTGTVTGKEINQLELNGRNFAQLVTLVPGVSNQSGQDEGLVGVQGNLLSTSMAAEPNTTTGNWTAATIWITAAIPA